MVVPVAAVRPTVLCGWGASGRDDSEVQMDAKKAKGRDAVEGAVAVPGGGVHASPGGDAQRTPGGYVSIHPQDRAGVPVGNEGLFREAARFPAIHDFLTCTSVEGRKREASSLIMFVEDGQPKVCLSDRDQGRVCFHTGEGFQDALESLEANLQAGVVDWRKKKGYKGK